MPSPETVEAIRAAFTREGTTPEQSKTIAAWVNESLRDATPDSLLHLLDDIEAKHERQAAREGASLTPREEQTLALASQGFPATEIASYLGITASTVKEHQRRAREKLGARSLIHAVALWLRSIAAE